MALELVENRMLNKIEKCPEKEKKKPKICRNIRRAHVQGKIFVINSFLEKCNNLIKL